MLRTTDEVLPLVKGIAWVSKTKLGLSFLLALLSTIALSLLWNLTEVGSPAFKFIAAITRPGWKCGHYLAAIVFGNEPQHGAAALMGLGGEVVIYTAFWFAVIVAIRRMRSKKRYGSNESFSQPET